MWFNWSKRPRALIEFMLKCAPIKSFGFRGEPLQISIDIDNGWSSGSETVKLISSKLSSKRKSEKKYYNTGS